MLLRVDAVGAVRHRDDISHRAVIFVPDLADQFLQDVLIRHDPERSAVVVSDHSEIDLFPRHDRQEVVDLGRLVDEEGLIQKRLDVQRLSLADVVPDILPDVQNTDNIVDRPLIDGEPAVVLFLDELQDLVLRHVYVDRRDVDTAGQDALHRHVAELER